MRDRRRSLRAGHAADLPIAIASTTSGLACCCRCRRSACSISPSGGSAGSDDAMTPFRTIDHAGGPAAARRPATATVLDVRTPGEYEQLGHIPGAWLLPVDLVASAPAVLPDDRQSGAGVLRARRAQRGRVASCWRRLASISVLNLSGGLARWTGPREFGAGRVARPVDVADRECRSVAARRQGARRGVRPRPSRAADGQRRLRGPRDRSRSGSDRRSCARPPIGCRFRSTRDVVDLETDPPPDLPVADIRRGARSSTTCIGR